jgi:hypothetical protein
MTVSFLLKDCALAVMATGESASSLVQLRDVLGTIPTNSIYHHFWGKRLSPTLAQPEYHNDFARWAHRHLHDDILSERLGIIDPTEYADLEDLRRTLLDILDERLDAVDFIVWSKGENKLHFLRSTIIVFDLGISIKHPSELQAVIPKIPTSAIFYHFIDARRRTPKKLDDFSVWLTGFQDEYSSLINDIRLIDPYFLSLMEIKKKLGELFNAYFT